MSYWLGVATIPAVVGAVALLFGAWKASNWLGDKLFVHVKVGGAGQRASFGAVVATARRVLVFDVFGVSFAVAVGYERSQAEEVRSAIYRVIGPAAPRVLTPEERAGRRTSRVASDASVTEEER